MILRNILQDMLIYFNIEVGIQVLLSTFKRV